MSYYLSLLSLFSSSSFHRNHYHHPEKSPSSQLSATIGFTRQGTDSVFTVVGSVVILVVAMVVVKLVAVGVAAGELLVDRGDSVDFDDYDYCGDPFSGVICQVFCHLPNS